MTSCQQMKFLSWLMSKGHLTVRVEVFRLTESGYGKNSRLIYVKSFQQNSSSYLDVQRRASIHQRQKKPEHCFRAVRRLNSHSSRKLNHMI